MELKSVIIADIKKGERTYRFEMPAGSSYGECYDAAFDLLKKIQEMAKDAVDKAEPKAPEEDAEAVGADSEEQAA